MVLTKTFWSYEVQTTWWPPASHSSSSLRSTSQLEEEEEGEVALNPKKGCLLIIQQRKDQFKMKLQAKLRSPPLQSIISWMVEFDEFDVSPGREWQKRQRWRQYKQSSNIHEIQIAGLLGSFSEIKTLDIPPVSPTWKHLHHLLTSPYFIHNYN